MVKPYMVPEEAKQYLLSKPCIVDGPSSVHIKNDEDNDWLWMYVSKGSEQVKIADISITPDDGTLVFLPWGDHNNDAKISMARLVYREVHNRIGFWGQRSDFDLGVGARPIAREIDVAYRCMDTYGQILHGPAVSQVFGQLEQIAATKRKRR
jgi:hypothetical protein